ncbi:hypothetical protein BDR26DRAFT_849972 [Obelidium mucronatum]|nr:hypothetical protein BDR26DRAFT_849972 [Obelidium mucronatum]
MNIVRAKSSWKVKKGYPNPYVPGWIYYNPFSFFNHGNKYKNTIEPSSESRLYLFSDRSKPALAEISHIENVELARIAGPVVKGTIHAVTHLATEFSSSNAIPGGAPYIQCPHEIIWFVSKRTPSSLGGSGNGGKLPRGDDALDFIMKKYQIVNGPNVVGRFDRLPPAQWPRKADSHDPKPLSDLFKYEFKNSTGGTVVSRFDYDVRTAYYSITNTVRGEIGSGEGSGWNTKSVKDGSYVIHVMARDWWGEWGHWKYPVTVNN